MGQKVNPIGFRLGTNKSWASNWFAGKEYPRMLKEDHEIRKFLNKRLKNANISKIVIERPTKKCKVYIHTARPGVIIGKKGAEIETLRRALQERINDEILINIVEVKKPDTDAQLVAANIASQIERRISYRRAMKRAMQNALGNGAEGIRVCVGGRLNGAEIARTEWYIEGSLPLHTLRADIDYGFSEALTTYGILGVKVWINHGEKYAMDDQNAGAQPARS